MRYFALFLLLLMLPVATYADPLNGGIKPVDVLFVLIFMLNGILSLAYLVTLIGKKTVPSATGRGTIVLATIIVLCTIWIHYGMITYSYLHSISKYYNSIFSEKNNGSFVACLLTADLAFIIIIFKTCTALIRRKLSKQDETDEKK